MAEGGYDEKALSIPAPFVNHSDLLFMPENVRFSFSEKYESAPPHFWAEALSLGQVLVRALQPSPPEDTVMTVTELANGGHHFHDGDCACGATWEDWVDNIAPKTCPNAQAA